MLEQAGPITVAMVVEGQLIAQHDNVIPSMPLDRANPEWRESAIRVGLEEGVCKDVACPARKEDTVRQLPALHRISFAILGHSIHRRILEPMPSGVPSSAPNPAGPAAGATGRRNRGVPLIRPRAG